MVLNMYKLNTNMREVVIKILQGRVVT